MLVNELKEYIFNNEKIEYILEQIGCTQIVYHSNYDYYSSCQADGDNEQGVNIRNCKYLNYRSYTRDVCYEDNKDLISLVQDTLKLNFVDTIKYLHNILGLTYSYNKNEIPKKKVVDNPLDIFKKMSSKHYVDVSEIKVLEEDVLNDYVPLLYIDWVKNEGIMEWTRKKFGIAYSYKQKRVIIPMRYWLTGELLGVNSRTVVDNYKEFGIKKYLITKTYPKNMNLFGLYENYDAIQKAGYVVVYESEKSVLKRDSRGDACSVALSGKSMSDEQASILKGLNVEIIISLDKDVSLEHIRSICEKFYGTRVSYTYDKYDLLNEKDSIADANKNKFEYLLKHRIKYDSKEHNEYIKWLNDK